MAKGLQLVWKCKVMEDFPLCVLQNTFPFLGCCPTFIQIPLHSLLSRARVPLSLVKIHVLIIYGSDLIGCQDLSEQQTIHRHNIANYNYHSLCCWILLLLWWTNIWTDLWTYRQTYGLMDGLKDLRKDGFFIKEAIKTNTESFCGQQYSAFPFFWYLMIPHRGILACV